ncbi:MAG: glycosyltransferase family 4 protein [Armatimonadetes bacterium]|nr:glycosyltransferase family 4 protein [Armatimonadota bacterium]
MRILLVNYEYPPLGGGGGTALRDIAEELATRHDIMVLTSGNRSLLAREMVGGVQVARIPVPGRGMRAVASIASMAGFMWAGRRDGPRIARDFAPDVVNTWFALPSGPVGATISRALDRPNLLTIIGGDIYDPSKFTSPHRWPVTRAIVRGAIRGADGICAISSDVRERAGRHYGVDTGQIEVIPLGLPEPRFERLSRDELGLPQDAFIAIAIGRLIPRKAFDRLIDALALTADRGIRLVIVGDGPLRKALEAHAAARGVGDRVTLTGWVDETRKFQLLAACDVFSLASLHEGFGIVYLEALHCGLPVVTSPDGGQRDFLRDGENSLLVHSNTPAEYARCWRTLAEDPQLRRRLGDGARRTAGNYSITRTAQRYEAAMGKLAGLGGA